MKKIHNFLTTEAIPRIVAAMLAMITVITLALFAHDAQMRRIDNGIERRFSEVSERRGKWATDNDEFKKKYGAEIIPHLLDTRRRVERLEEAESLNKP